MLVSPRPPSPFLRGVPLSPCPHVPLLSYPIAVPFPFVPLSPRPRTPVVLPYPHVPLSPPLPISPYPHAVPVSPHSPRTTRWRCRCTVGAPTSSGGRTPPLTPPTPTLLVGSISQPPPLPTTPSGSRVGSPPPPPPPPSPSPTAGDELFFHPTSAPGAVTHGMGGGDEGEGGGGGKKRETQRRPRGVNPSYAGATHGHRLHGASRGGPPGIEGVGEG